MAATALPTTGILYDAAGIAGRSDVGNGLGKRLSAHEVADIIEGANYLWTGTHEFAGLTSTNDVVISSSTPATSSATGALRVVGGISTQNYIQATFNARCRGFDIWLSTGGFGWDNDLYLYRDAAGILAQRKSTNAQANRLYAWQDGSNDLYFGIDYQTTPGTATVGPVGAGTNSASTGVTAIGDWNFTGTVTGIPGGNPFDQSLNTTDEVFFSRVGVGSTQAIYAGVIASLGKYTGTGLGGLSVRSSSFIGFSSVSNPRDDTDAGLWRDAAGIIAQRNSTNAQATRLYAWQDGSNDLYFGIDYQTTPSVCTVGPVGQGINANNIGVTAVGEWAFPDLPTADPVSAGALWNNAGDVMISDGVAAVASVRQYIQAIFTDSKTFVDDPTITAPQAIAYLKRIAQMFIDIKDNQ